MTLFLAWVSEICQFQVICTVKLLLSLGRYSNRSARLGSESSNTLPGESVRRSNESHRTWCQVCCLPRAGFVIHLWFHGRFQSMLQRVSDSTGMCASQFDSLQTDGPTHNDH